MKPALKFLAAASIATAFALPASAQTLNVVTAGSQNMLDYITDYLGPMFEKANPGVKVNAVSTGPGDAGSQKIMEKLKSQADAGNDKWDIDVAVVHQKKGGEMVSAGLLSEYKNDIATGKLATGDSSKMALGVKVDGYVMPMFHSQTALAYNPDLVPNPPKSYAELTKWAAENPKVFGYNGVKGGMSGVAFVMGWMYANTDMADKLMNGPFDAADTAKWDKVLADLKAFNENVSFTPGNAGTLDMLNRGEIALGPVWVDMFYSWQADGRLNPNLKLLLLEPGMPGQPMFYVVPAKAANADLARKFVELATSPPVQAEGIVTRFNWYPGIDAQHVQGSLKPEDWQKLFTDVTPEDLASKARPFPVGPYFDAIKEAYESKVAN